MQRIIIHNTKRVVWLALLALPCLAMAQKKTPEWVYCHPEQTIGGIRYFKLSSCMSDVDEYPSMDSLRHWGFTINPNDPDTYIAPDGKVVPSFCSGLYAVPPNQRQPGEPAPEGALPYYTGDVYLPDYLAFNGKGYLGDRISYVLGFYWSAMGSLVTSIRTSLYMPVETSCFKFALNLQKVQIGGCYSVEPCPFWYCNKLETVILEKTPYIYRYAFAGCPQIKSVVLQSAVELPPVEDATAFEESVYKNATLYLPDNLMEQCNSDPVWSKFVHKKSLKECKVELVKP